MATVTADRLERAAEPRRCYWCGPLAEQVHRSRRSAPCGGSAPVTVCEPGYEYCAVVATSPPRIESRYCVKMYQDECYPLFCNSTKTWKMTCPCRGDLCNGPNTDRETEAFALLPKLVAKTHNSRIKKRTAVASPHLIKHERKMRIIGNGDAANDSEADNASDKLIVNENYDNLQPDADATQSEDTQSDQPTNTVVEHHDDNGKENAENVVDNKDNGKSTTPDNHLIEIEIHVSDPTDESVTIKDNELPCTSDISSANESDKPTEEIETEKHEEIPITITDTTKTEVKSNEITKVAQSDETIKPTEAMQQDIITAKIISESPSELPTIATEVKTNDEATKAIDEMQNDAPIISPANSDETMKPTEETKTVETSTMKSVKPSEGMPTAEALQENGSPTSLAEKTTTTPTTEATTTITITQENLEKRITTPASRRKNSATQITFSYVLFLSCILYL
ncbi:hypothetical protein MSG28_011901 [Choristoneura fumiferana]|uniref:Uncharacterized protein n=1 Tax=Choristoneura fumiferana TaxID=7141 RepID=A0ACC0KMX5_CHOFU|nr:hypothetical protein MSG28_011901 [Choristoneura fumiferana]